MQNLASAKEKITAARIQLLRGEPFFGYALMHVSIVSKDEPKPPGPKIVYNPGFVESLDTEELMGVLCHELLHYLLQHTKRAKEARKSLGEGDRQYYARMNIAEDIVVNAILVRNHFKLPRRGERRPLIPEYDYSTGKFYVQLVDENGKKYTIWDPDKKTVEEIYWEIRDLAMKDGGSNENDTMYFSDDTTDEADSEEGDKSEGEGESSKDGKTEDILSRGAGTSSKSPQELLSEAYMYARMHGNAPAGIDRFVSIALKPKMNWKALLRRYLVQMIPHDYSFRKPSKKSPENIILPGIKKDVSLEAVIAVDTSASISDTELSEFLTEINWLAKNYSSLRLTLVSCDTEVQSVREIHNKYQLSKFTPRGGGGTDFRPVFELAAKKRAKLVIYFTDGYGEFPSTPPKMTTIWVVCRNGAPESHFPFGKVVRMN